MISSHGNTRKLLSLIQPVLRRHEGNRIDQELPLSETSSVSTTSSSWQCQVTESPAPDRIGSYDIEVTFTIKQGEELNASVGLAFGFENWSEDNYVLFPSAVYHGNNFDVLDTPYPPVWREAEHFRLDMPTTTTPVPYLGGDSHRIEQTTGDTASPTMGFYSASQKRGFLVQTEQGSRLGNHGLTVESSADHDRARFLVTAPAVREFRQDHSKTVPSEDRGATWKAGEQLTLRVRICVFKAEGLQELFVQYGNIRKDLNPARSTNNLPLGAASDLVLEKYNRDNWVENPGYYKLAPNAHTTFKTEENPLCFLWQLGWVGGGMMTLSMLAHGDELTRFRAWKNLEMIFDRTQAPSGFFYGLGDGTHFYGDGFDRPFNNHCHMVRKSGDWLYFAILQFDLISQQGRDVPPQWQDSIRRLADAFVRVWENHRQFGQYVDIETGDLLIGGSTAGAIVPGALALASAWYNEPSYLEIAEVSARGYLDETLATGITTGGPGEILSAPDSESSFALLESLVTLMEMTGSNEWRDAALAITRHAATWVVSYDYDFPANSSLGKSGARSCGAVFANVQNKHGAPGICTWSGDSLFRLWRATGDPLALDLIRDIAHGITQYVSLPDAPLSDSMQPGWMCERVNLSDWETADGVGGQIFGSSSWPETSLLLTYLQIPGLYVQPDTGQFHVIDHINVKSHHHSPDGLELVLHNPTSFDATVKVLCEDATSRTTPMGLNALANARVLHLPAGATVTEIFTNPIQ